MKNMRDEKYSIQLLTGSEIVGRVGALFRKNNNTKDERHLHWMYIKNNAGGALTSVAVTSSAEDAAVYSVFKVRMLVNGTQMIAAQSVDTLTDEKHRGKGLFSKLADAVYKKADEEGVAFVYGFPNSSSGPVFFGKLGWEEGEAPPYLIYPSNLTYPLRRKFKWLPNVRLPNFLFSLLLQGKCLSARDSSLSIVEMKDFEGPAYAALWRKFSTTFDTGVQRDAAYMHWRFLERPKNDYRIKGLICRGELIAVVVYTVLQKHGGKIGYVMEFICDPEKKTSAERLMQHAVQEMNRQAVDAILAWNRKDSIANSVYRAALFTPLPRALQPIKLHFGYRVNSLNANARGIAESKFYISYADSDTV